MPCSEPHDAGDTGSRRSEELSGRTAPPPRGLRATAQLHDRSDIVAWQRGTAKASPRAARRVTANRGRGSAGGTRRPGARARGRGIVAARRATALRSRVAPTRLPPDEGSPHHGGAPCARGWPQGPRAMRGGRGQPRAGHRPFGVADKPAGTNRLPLLAARVSANRLPAPSDFDGRTIPMYGCGLALPTVRSPRAADLSGRLHTRHATVAGSGPLRAPGPARWRACAGFPGRASRRAGRCG